MSAEVEVYRPRELLPVAVTERDVVDGWVEVVTKVAKLADMIADTDFVPKALRNKPAAITACMLTGREIGVGPMLSMKVIHMVNGTPSLAAEYKRARALERGHEIVYEETSITRCVVRGRRKGEDSWVTVSWTIEDARRAKLAGKDVWQQNPRRMLEARATGELCDLKFPDCSWGLATTEALQDGDTSESGDAPAAGPRTAQRRQRQAAAQETGQGTGKSGTAQRATGSLSGSESAKAHGEPPAASPDLPPLPGEDDPSDQGPKREAAPGKASSGLVGVIQAHFKRLGFDEHDDREERLSYTAIIAGIDGELASTKDLTDDQAKAVADTLSRCKDRERLILLTTRKERGDAS